MAKGLLKQFGIYGLDTNIPLNYPILSYAVVSTRHFQDRDSESTTSSFIQTQAAPHGQLHGPGERQLGIFNIGPWEVEGKMVHKEALVQNWK